MKGDLVRALTCLDATIVMFLLVGAEDMALKRKLFSGILRLTMKQMKNNKLLRLWPTEFETNRK